MKKQYLLTLICALTAGAFNCQGAPLACVTDTFSSYMALGSVGCTVGTDYTFTNFNYVISAAILANNVGASDITVAPSFGPGGPSFTFSANWDAGGLLASTYVGILRFTGTSTGPSFTPFESQTLGLTGHTSGGISVAAVSETNCVGGLLGPTGVACLSGGITETLGAQITGANTTASANVAFSPNATVDVYKSIVLVGAVGGNAHLSSFSQSFGVAAGPGGTDTPEPVTTALLGGGLIGLAVMRRFRPKQD